MANGTLIPLYREQVSWNGGSYGASQSDDYYESSSISSTPARNAKGIDTTAYTNPQYDYRSWLDAVRNKTLQRTV